MKKLCCILSALLLAPMLAACGGSAVPVSHEISSDSLHVKAVEDLPEDFILLGDRRGAQRREILQF